MVTMLFQVSMSVLILTILGCSASAPSHKTRRAPLSAYEQQLQEADLYFTKQIEAGASDGLASAYFERGKTRYTLAEYDDAIADLKESLRLEPGAAQVYAVLGACYHVKKQSYEELVARGWSEFYDHKLGVPVSTFTDAIQLNSRKADAWWGRSKSYLEQGRAEKALPDLDMAIKLDSKITEAYFERGKVFRSLGKYDLALADLKQFLKEKPDHVDALFNRGAIHATEGRLDDALSDLNRVLQLRSNHLSALVRRAQVYIQKDDLDKGLTDAGEILRLAPNSGYPHIVQSIVAERRNNAVEAVQHLTQGIRLSADYSETALKIVDRIILRNPGNAQAYHARALVYYQIGRFDEALADFDVLFRSEGMTAQSWYDRGMTYLRKGRYEEAIADLDQAILSQGSLATVLLSDQLVTQTASRQASRLGREGNIGGLSGPGIYKNLAWAYFQTGRSERAVQLLLEATGKNGNDHETWHFLGLLMAKQGNLPKAIECLLNADRLAPVNTTYKITAQDLSRELAKQEYARNTERLSAIVIGGLSLLGTSLAIDEARCDANPECTQRRLEQQQRDLMYPKR